MTLLPGGCRKICCGLLLLLVLAPAAKLYGADPELAESRKRLADLEKKIEATLEDLRTKRSEGGSLGKDLGALDAEIGRVDRMVRRSDRELAELDEELAARREDFAQLEASLEQTEKQVRERLVALYKTGETGLLKVLLSSAESPRLLMEKYAFLSRMVRHDRQLITTYRDRSRVLKTSLDELEKLRQKQNALAERRRAERQALKSAQAAKRRLLAKVRQDAQALDQMLADLRAKAARLNDLVKKLESEETPSYTENLSGLSARKGRLPWPVDGRVRVGFGTNRHGDLGTLIESHGLEISTPVGSAVTSIAPGKVMFAKRLRGYGKLLIIDHGGKDYSLYAHVGRFLKQAGDPVAAGELIAYSGYEGRDYVYFEIRHGGQPLNPQEWLLPR